MYSFVVFDVDGTLIDTEKVVMESYGKIVFEEFGRQFTMEDMASVCAIPTPQALATLGFKDIDQALLNYNKYLFKGFPKVKPFEGIAELLETIKLRNIISGIVTSRTKNEVLKDVCLQKIMAYFSYVLCSEDTEKHKPDPEPLLKVIEMADTDSSKAIYLGDTYYDYMCAKNAGVKFALALWGARYTEDIKADYVLKEPKDLLPLIGT